MSEICCEECGNTEVWSTTAWGRSYCGICHVIHIDERPKDEFLSDG